VCLILAAVASQHTAAACSQQRHSNAVIQLGTTELCRPRLPLLCSGSRLMKERVLCH
jgi:hypothetical protein